jgi:hypothetical protein
MVSTDIRVRRRTLRYRHMIVRQMVQMINRVSGLLLETGVSHNKQQLHKVGYFGELLTTNKDPDDSIRPLLRLSRETIVRLEFLLKEEGAPGALPRFPPLRSERRTDKIACVGAQRAIGKEHRAISRSHLSERQNGIAWMLGQQRDEWCGRVLCHPTGVER